MNLKSLALKPFEVVAGIEYPDAEQIRRECSEQGAWPHEIDMSVSEARSEFYENLVGLRGLRGMIK